jgi:tubulin--tyrosine ligase
MESNKGYFYQGGYIRTSCKEFDLNDMNDRMVHLTNDAIQKRSKGKPIPA